VDEAEEQQSYDEKQWATEVGPSEGIRHLSEQG